MIKTLLTPQKVYKPSLNLSVIIPVYNELHTVPTVLARVIQTLPEVPKELLVVDDGSTDGTREWLEKIFGDTDSQAAYLCLTDEGQLLVVQGNEYEQPESLVDVSPLQSSPVAVKVFLHSRNRGKGAALRTGFQGSSGDVLVIQDADLEYDPQELCDTTLTDIEVCYKMFRRDVLKGLKLTCNDFGFEVEFTVKVTKPRRWRIYEVGISYYGRTYREGKKINWKDGVKALWYILKFWLKN